MLTLIRLRRPARRITPIAAAALAALAALLAAGCSSAEIGRAHV